MKHHHITNLKRRIAMLAIVLVSAVIPVLAQSDLAIGQLFDGRFRNDVNAQETIMTGDVMKKYNISTFRSLTFTNNEKIAQNIAPLVKPDGEKAVSKEVKMKNGELFGAFYELPKKSGKRRYIFYLNRFLTGGNKLIIIYIDGKVDLEELKSLM